MEKVAAALAELAERVDDLPWRSVWPAFHACAGPSADEAYGDRVGVVFDALRAAANCRYQEYLSAVLKRQHKEGRLAVTLRTAAQRVTGG